MALNALTEGILFQIGVDPSDFEKGLSSVRTGLDSLEKHASAMSTAIGSVADPLFSALTKGLTLVTGAMTGVAAMALNVGGNFESEMTRVAAISGATAQELEQLTDKARELGRDLPISATNAAEALASMAQRGWSVSSMLQTVGDVVNLSISQQHDLAGSADILGATLTNFRLPVSNAAKVVDVFNNACNQSAMTMDKFGLSLKYVSPIASALGLSFESMVSMLESLSDAGFTAETMGTGLRMVLLKISEAAGKGGGEFRKAGVEILDASGKLRPVRDVLEQLGKSTLDLAGYQSIFGAEAATAALALSGNAGKLKEYEAGLAKIGSTQEMVNRQLGTWRVTLDNLKSSLEEGNIAVFDQIKTGAVDGAKGITELVNALTGWIKQSQIVREAVDAFSDGLGLSIISAEKLRGTLDAIDTERLTGKFREAGASVRALYEVFMALADMVPWKFIADHLEVITFSILTLWGAGKIAGIVAGIASFAGALAQLSIATVGAGAGLGGLAIVAKGMAAIFGGWTIVIGGAIFALYQMYQGWKDGREAANAYADSVNRTREALEKLGEKELDRRIAAVTRRVEELRNAKAIDSAWGLENVDEKLAEAEETLKRLKEARLEAQGTREGNEIWSDGKATRKGIEMHEREIQLLREKRGETLKISQINEDERKRREHWQNRTVENVPKTTSSAMSDIVAAWDGLVLKAQESMKKMGLSAAEAGRILGDSFAESVNRIAEKSGKAADDPFLTENIKRESVDLVRQSSAAYGELGKAAQDAFGKMVKGAENSKNALQRLSEAISGITNPMKAIVEAVQGGFLSGSGAQKGMEWINRNLGKVQEYAVMQTKERFAGLGLDPETIKGLARMNISDTMGAAGLPQPGGSSKAAALFGDFVRGTPRSGATISAPITIQIDKVIATDERQARQSGENIGRGIVRPMQGLTY